MRARAVTVASYPFPLPPLSEQHRIVTEIDRQFIRLDASVESLKGVQANLKRYRASLFKAACEGRLVPTEAELAKADGRDYEHAADLLDRVLAERCARWESQPNRRGKYKEPVGPDTADLPELPEGWVWATVGQVASVRSGFGFPKAMQGKRSGDLPFYKVSDVSEAWLRGDAVIGKAHHYLSYDEADLLRAKPLAEGATVFAKVGEAVHLNRRSLLFATSLVDNNLMGVIPLGSGIISKFMYFVMCTIRLGDASRATVLPSVRKADIEEIPFALPPLAEQRRIVAEIERRLSVIQKTEAAVGSSLTGAERLRQSILKQAFSGKLVPQDANDEPASVLLERIRAEREAAEAAARSNGQPRRGRSKKSSGRQGSRQKAAP